MSVRSTNARMPVGWERRGLNHYYYWKTRQGGTVRSVYMGRGETAHAIAALAALEARDRAERRDQEQAVLADQRDRSAGAERHLAAIERLAEEAVRAVLHAEGLHEHRGEWRRKRGA